jgi:hypothetical protein
MHPTLPPERSNHYTFRARLQPAHTTTLSNSNLMTHMLYKEILYSVVGFM